MIPAPAARRFGHAHPRPRPAALERPGTEPAFRRVRGLPANRPDVLAGRHFRGVKRWPGPSLMPPDGRPIDAVTAPKPGSAS